MKEYYICGIIAVVSLISFIICTYRIFESNGRPIDKYTIIQAVGSFLTIVMMTIFAVLSYIDGR